jgi:hypothetical protein
MEKNGRRSMEERFRAIGNLLARKSLSMERTKDLSALPEEHSTLFEGWLLKEGRNILSMTKWQRRYFVLNETRLVYWNTEQDCRSGLAPKGVIDLTGCSLAMVDEKKRAHTFGIFHPQRRDYLFEAQNKRELLVWMKKVEGALLGRERKVPSLTDFELLKVVGKGASGVVLQVIYFICRQSHNTNITFTPHTSCRTLI